jgi:hypothetical protein
MERILKALHAPGGRSAIECAAPTQVVANAYRYEEGKAVNVCQRKYLFPHTVRPKTVAPRSARPYIRLNQLAAANSGSPSPLQLKRSGNAVIDGIVY